MIASTVPKASWFHWTFLYGQMRRGVTRKMKYCCAGSSEGLTEVDTFIFKKNNWPPNLTLMAKPIVAAQRSQTQRSVFLYYFLHGQTFWQILLTVIIPKSIWTPLLFPLPSQCFLTSSLYFYVE